MNWCAKTCWQCRRHSRAWRCLGAVWRRSYENLALRCRKWQGRASELEDRIQSEDLASLQIAAVRETFAEMSGHKCCQAWSMGRWVDGVLMRNFGGPLDYWMHLHNRHWAPCTCWEKNNETSSLSANLYHCKSHNSFGVRIADVLAGDPAIGESLFCLGFSHGCGPHEAIFRACRENLTWDQSIEQHGNSRAPCALIIFDMPSLWRKYSIQVFRRSKTFKK